MTDSQLILFLEGKLRQKNSLENLAGEMIATIVLNLEKGHLITTSAEATNNFSEIIQQWKRRWAANK